MTREELRALEPGTKVRLVKQPQCIGTFRSLNWAGLACIDGVDGAGVGWECARMHDEVEVVRDKEGEAMSKELVHNDGSHEMLMEARGVALRLTDVALNNVLHHIQTLETGPNMAQRIVAITTAIGYEMMRRAVARVDNDALPAPPLRSE